MDDFERPFLLCRSDYSTVSRSSPLNGLSWIPGPLPVVGATSSTELDEVEEHPLERIRDALRQLPDVRETTFEYATPEAVEDHVRLLSPGGDVIVC